MALSLGQTELADNAAQPSPESEYLTCTAEPALAIHMHRDAVDGIAHDVGEAIKAQPGDGAEIGGLLLGSVTPGDLRTVSIERYQRLECEHRLGPLFSLDAAELDAIRTAAVNRPEDEEWNVLGFYRSNMRPELSIGSSDREILDCYFPDPGDLTLLLRPVAPGEIHARFFVRCETGEWQAAGEEFPFRGRVLGPLGVPDAEPEEELLGTPERPRRLVADFMPTGDGAPAPPAAVIAQPALFSKVEDTQSRTRRWWPLAGALLLVGGALAFLFQIQRADKAETAAAVPRAESTTAIRPLGLYADPSGDTWRISWNPSASALQNARGVALFVREGDDQNRIDLAVRDLESGTYQYRPKPEEGPSKDVTFRLEVTDAGGRLSAESFRVIRSAAPAPAAPSVVPPARAAGAHPKPLKRVPPTVPAGIRPRIHGSIPVDVRVAIDARGHVTSAVPAARPRNALNSLLASRAVAAAKQWRFESGPATEIIHFVFEP